MIRRSFLLQDIEILLKRPLCQFLAQVRGEKNRQDRPTHHELFPLIIVKTSLLTNESYLRSSKKMCIPFFKQELSRGRLRLCSPMSVLDSFHLRFNLAGSRRGCSETALIIQQRHDEFVRRWWNLQSHCKLLRLVHDVSFFCWSYALDICLRIVIHESSRNSTYAFLHRQYKQDIVHNHGSS